MGQPLRLHHSDGKRHIEGKVSKITPRFVEVSSPGYYARMPLENIVGVERLGHKTPTRNPAPESSEDGGVEKAVELARHYFKGVTPFSAAVVLSPPAFEAYYKAEWPTSRKNNLPDSAFLYISPGGKKDDEGKTVPRSLRHFPYKNEAGELDEAHLRNALGRIPQSDVPQDVKDKAQARAGRLASRTGIDTDLGKAIRKGVMHRMQMDGGDEGEQNPKAGDRPNDGTAWYVVARRKALVAKDWGAWHAAHPYQPHPRGSGYREEISPGGHRAEREAGGQNPERHRRGPNYREEISPGGHRSEREGAQKWTPESGGSRPTRLPDGRPTADEFDSIESRYPYGRPFVPMSESPRYQVETHLSPDDKKPYKVLDKDSWSWMGEHPTGDEARSHINQLENELLAGREPKPQQGVGERPTYEYNPNWKPPEKATPAPSESPHDQRLRRQLDAIYGRMGKASPSSIAAFIKEDETDFKPDDERYQNQREYANGDVRPPLRRRKRSGDQSSSGRSQGADEAVSGSDYTDPQSDRFGVTYGRPAINA